MSNFILMLKYKYNKFLEKIKINQINKCNVIIFESEDALYQCENYTYNKYCDTHLKLISQECSSYHLYNLNTDPNNVQCASFIEYYQREKYRRKYNITTDYNHIKWEHKLESMFHDKFYEENGYIINIDFIIESYFLDFIKIANL